MKDVIPPGFERCPDCGEFNGQTQARYLNWELAEDVGGEPIPAQVVAHLRRLKADVASTLDPQRVISVRCLCHGPFCKRCGVVRVHQSGSNTYDPQTNRVEHWPWFAGMMPCAACREQDERKGSGP